MDKDRIAHLVHRLRANLATEDEKAALESFWRQAQEDHSFLDELPEEEKQLLKAGMYEEIQSRIAGLQRQPKGRQRALSFSGAVLKIAASLSFLAVVAFIWWLLAENQERVFQTAYGEDLQLVLPDSSVVILNGNSSLRYNNTWGSGHVREVWIEGEAFFDVVHTQNDKKFIVHTGHGEHVQVLGTRFNVRIRRGKTEVMLERGKVKFQVTGLFREETVYLAPGELVRFEGSKLEKQKVNPLQYAGWKNHKLYFDHTELREVGRILEDTYGLTVVFDDENLAHRRLSGEIDSRSVADILKAIGESLNIRVTDDRSTVIFSAKGLGR